MVLVQNKNLSNVMIIKELLAWAGYSRISEKKLTQISLSLDTPVTMAVMLAVAVCFPKVSKMVKADVLSGTFTKHKEENHEISESILSPQHSQDSVRHYDRDSDERVQTAPPLGASTLREESELQTVLPTQTDRHSRAELSSELVAGNQTGKLGFSEQNKGTSSLHQLFASTIQHIHDERQLTKASRQLATDSRQLATDSRQLAGDCLGLAGQAIGMLIECDGGSVDTGRVRDNRSDGELQDEFEGETVDVASVPGDDLMITGKG
jgi:hypothetical protein